MNNKRIVGRKKFMQLADDGCFSDAEKRRIMDISQKPVSDKDMMRYLEAIVSRKVGELISMDGTFIENFRFNPGARFRNAG